MVLFLKNIQDEYEIFNLARMLFPKIIHGEYCEENCLAVISKVTANEEVFTVSLFVDGKSASQTLCCTANQDNTLQLSKLIYKITQGLCDIHLRWGLLTGIRPIKLFHKQLALGESDNEVLSFMKSRYGISDDMADLCLSIAHTEEKINNRLLKNGFSLYVSIPFCPKRCSYCSFVSESVERDRSLLYPYVEMLCKEIALTAKTAKTLGLTLQTIYIGGGTPTVLENSELFKVLNTIRINFDMENILEYTVEAGRPDTITRENLEMLKTFSVDRISINPQTMQDRVLEGVGRNHTANDIVLAYNLAREVGFNSINMDIIAGLPNDNFEGFSDSIAQVSALKPENITVHSLTIKRGSELSMQNTDKLYEKQAETATMVDFARASLIENNYHPYYLYRQKGTVGNLDNTGYAKSGRECIYNILMMDETQTVLTAGAGAVAKYKNKEGQIARIFAHTLPREYIKDFPRIENSQLQLCKHYAERELV